MIDQIKGGEFSPPLIPTLTGPCGIRYDFNNGPRIQMPAMGSPWQVIVYDDDSGNSLSEHTIADTNVHQLYFKTYFVDYRIEAISSNGLTASVKFDATHQDVLVFNPSSSIGDSIAWIEYVSEFQRQHNCNITLQMAKYLIPLFDMAYPNIKFADYDQSIQDQYATYQLGIILKKTTEPQAFDYRRISLQQCAAYNLGVDPQERRPTVCVDESCDIPESPYVCISTKSTNQAKYWNNSTGWQETVDFIKELGYSVVCLDQFSVTESELGLNAMPNGVIDMTGSECLTRRAKVLSHAEFFIGLSSGLSWLAWAVGIPVIMISGATLPFTEFYTPHRIINTHVCRGCWNDTTISFDPTDNGWCPRLRGTDRQFECTSAITSQQVINTIKRLIK